MTLFKVSSMKLMVPFLIIRMKQYRAILFLALTLGCLSCSALRESNPKKSHQILSELDRIEKAFDQGDAETACALQVKLSRELLDYEEISLELLKSVKEFQVRCGNSSFLIDF